VNEGSSHNIEDRAYRKRGQKAGREEKVHKTGYRAQKIEGQRTEKRMEVRKEL